MFFAPQSPEQRSKTASKEEPYKNLFSPNAISKVGFLEHRAPVMLAPKEAIMTRESAPSNNEFVYQEAFTQGLDRALRDVKDRNGCGALILVSFKNLAMIINGYGREAAEEAIHQVIQEVANKLDAGDVVQRIHRDQLAIILSHSSPAQMYSFAHQISKIIQNFGAIVDNDSLHLICEIGSVDFPASADTVADIMDKAYVALHSPHAAQVHRSYTDVQHEAAQSRQKLGLANFLRRAIRDNKLRLAYQPIISSKNGEVAHYECLLRVIGDDGKISSAGPLIPIAEEMGMVDMIDHLVLDMVVQELEESPNLHLALNVSNLTTENSHWLEQCRHLLRHRPEIASRMQVEITETAAQKDLRNAAYFVASLQELGCEVALDDFGAGYTSFKQLKTLSVDVVKIDGAYIRDIVENPDSQFIVKTLVEFARNAGLASIAECVENGEVAKVLMRLGVDYMQGYYFGKPQNFRSWKLDK